MNVIVRDGVAHYLKTLILRHTISTFELNNESWEFRVVMTILVDDYSVSWL